MSSFEHSTVMLQRINDYRYALVIVKPDCTNYTLKRGRYQIFKQVFSELTQSIEKSLHRYLDIDALEVPMEGFFD